MVAGSARVAVPPLDGAPADTVGHKFLNVWTKRQGELRLWPHCSFMIWITLLAVMWQLWELLCLSVENVDHRDIVDDYRLTRSGVQGWHDVYFGDDHARPTLSVSVVPDATRVGWEMAFLRNYTREWTDPDDMIDPRLLTVYNWLRWRNMMQVSDTSYKMKQYVHEYRHTMSPASATFRTDAARLVLFMPEEATVTSDGSSWGGAPAPEPEPEPELDPCADSVGWVDVPLYRLEQTSLTSSTYQVRYLVRAAAEVAWYRGCYEIQKVHSAYSTETWQSSGTDLPSFPEVEESNGWSIVELVLVDQSQPKPALPHFTGTSRLYLGLLIFPVLLLVWVATRSCLQIWIHVRYRTNQSLPPPFYASFRAFRGW